MKAKMGSERRLYGIRLAGQAGNRRPKPHLAAYLENIGEYGLISEQQKEQLHGLGRNRTQLERAKRRSQAAVEQAE